MKRPALDVDIYKFDNPSLNRKPDKEELGLIGDGKNGLVILVQAPKTERDQLMDQDSFLNRVIGSTGLKLPDSLVLCLSDPPEISFTYIREKFLVNSLIVFGIDPEKLGLELNIEKNRVIRYGPVKCCFTDALDDLASDDKKKRPFWKALQDMFGLRE